MSKTLRKIIAVSSALLMIAGIGATASNSNVNAKHRHARTHRIYRHRRRARRIRHYKRSSTKWHYLTNHGKYRYKYGNYKLWEHPHYVFVKHPVKMSRMSGGKHTSDAALRPTLHKTLKPGTIIKGYAPTAGLGGYVILHAPMKLPVKYNDYWTILASQNKKYAKNGYYWAKAIK